MLWYMTESTVALPILYGIMASMIEFRYEKKRCIFVIAVAIIVSLTADGVLFWIVGKGVTVYTYAWISTCIPSIIALFYLAKHRDFRFAFAYLTETVLVSILTAVSAVFAWLLPFRHPIFQILIHMVLLLTLLFLCRKLLYKKLFAAVNVQGHQWGFYCILPILMLLLWFLYMLSPARMIDIENKVGVPYVGYFYLEDVWLLLITLAMAFYVVSLIVLTITLTHKTAIEQEEKQALDMQVRALREQWEIAGEKEENFRILRHDMHHHLGVIAGLLDDLQYDKVQKYLSQVEGFLGQTKQITYCRNPIVNSILASCSTKAQKKAICFSASVQVPEALPVDDMDIGAVLANGLENALNACLVMPPEVDRFIDVRFLCHNRQFVLDISNSFDGEVVFDENGHPVSHIEGHGVGHRSISAFERKYGAITQYSAENGVFELRLMFSK